MSPTKARLVLLAMLGLLVATSIAVLTLKLVLPADAQTATPGAAPSTQPDRWSVKFSSGQSVELLGIQEDPSADGKWWGGDAQPVPSPEPGDVRSNVQGDVGTRTVRFILRGRGLAKHARDITVQVSPSSITRDSGSEGDRIEAVAAVPADAATAELRIGLANGAWSNDVTYDVATAQTTSATDPAQRIGDIALSEEGAETLLRFTRVGPRDPLRQVRVILVAGSQQFQMQHGSERSGNVEFYFRCAKKAVTKVMLQSRTYEMTSMKNVSLKPTTRP